MKNAHLSVQIISYEVEKENDYTKWCEPRITTINHLIKDVESWKKDHIAQAAVGPQDSNSNVSQSSRPSKGGSKISASSLSVKYIKPRLNRQLCWSNLLH